MSERQALPADMRGGYLDSGKPSVWSMSRKRRAQETGSSHNGAGPADRCCQQNYNLLLRMSRILPQLVQMGSRMPSCHTVDTYPKEASAFQKPGSLSGIISDLFPQGAELLFMGTELFRTMAAGEIFVRLFRKALRVPVKCDLPTEQKHQ